MLKCKVNTKQFQESLKKLEVVIPNKTKLPILEGIKLSITNNSIQLATTDLENYVTATINDFNAEMQGSTVITNIKEIMKSFKFMKESYTEIEVNNNDIIIINGNRNIKMKCENVDEYPSEFTVGELENTYTYNTKSLYNRIKKIDFARTKDDTRPILEGIHFNNEDMVTLDGYRIALNKDTSLTIEKPFTIAPGTINFINKTLNSKVENEVLISTNDKYITLKYDNLIVTSRLLEGKYFNYKDIFLREYSTIKLNTKKLKDNIEFLSIYTKGIKSELTTANITSSKLKLIVNTEQGLFDTEDNINSELDLTIGFNNKYMLEALKSIQEEEIEIRINRDITPIEIKESENSFYIVLPVRLGNAA